MHGFGTYIYGSERKKHMEPGKKYDPWDHVFEDDVYKGEWIKGKRSGRGVFTKSSGEQWDGEWKNGKEQGWGKWTRPDGATYEGQWKNGERDGKGTMTGSDGNMYEGEWHRGREHGRAQQAPPVT